MLNSSGAGIYTLPSKIFPKLSKILSMKSRVIVAILLSSILSLILNTSPSFANEKLWETKLSSGFTVNSGVDARAVTSFSRLNSVGFYVDRSNPDSLIAQIVMDQPLAESPLSEDKKITGGLWIFSKTPNCLNDKNCDQVLQVGLPVSSTVRSEFEATTVNPIQYGNGNFENFKASGCLSPVRLIQNQSGRGIYEIALSITCLAIPKSFYSYAYMSEDIGLSNKIFNFTNSGSADYPFFELAKKYYDANGGFEGQNIRVAAIGMKNLAIRTSLEANQFIFKMTAEAKKMEKKGKKGILVKMNAKSKLLQSELRKTQVLNTKMNPLIHSTSLRNQASEIGGKIAVILRVQGEMLRLTL